MNQNTETPFPETTEADTQGGESKEDLVFEISGEELREPASADHPADPAVYPIPVKPALSTYVALSVEEMAEKGKLLARKLKEIAGLEEERKDINHQIKDVTDEVDKLAAALNSGTVEVLTEQQDLLRSPVGGEAAAAAFTEMARDAEQASQAGGQEGKEAIDELNAKAEEVQTAAGVAEPSQEFKDSVAEFKANKGKKSKKVSA